MKPREREPGREKASRPAVKTKHEYSKAADGRDSALSSCLRACEQLRTAIDVDTAIRFALDGLVHPSSGCRSALFLILDAGSARLRGAGFARSGSSLEDEREDWRSLQLPVDAGPDSVFAQALTGENCGRSAAPGIADWLHSALDPWVGDRDLRLLPVRGAARDHGILILQSAPAPATACIAAQLGLALDRLRDAEEAARPDLRAAIVADTLHEAIQAASLSDVLERLVHDAVASFAADRASVWTYTETRRELRLTAQARGGESTVTPGVDPRDEAIARACIERRARVHEDGVSGYPLSAFGEWVGVLVCAGDANDAKWPELYAPFAALSILAARLFERLREGEQRLADTQAALVQSERLAALGECCAKLSQEIRNPLVAIGGYARRIERGLGDDDPNREHARLIAREARRLETLFEQQSEMSRVAAPRLVRRPFNGIVQACVGLVRDDLLARGVTVEEAYSEQVPELLLDQDRIRQMVVNILRHGLESLEDGDTLRIETFRQRDRVLLEIAHTGERPAGEILDQLFVPFAATRPSGTGLGLSVARQIVKEHGGEIGVRCEGDWTAIFTIALPIRDNLERRRMRDRRASRDRRGRWPPRA